MNIIVHYPKKTNAKEELARRVAEVHGRAVTEKILSLNWEEEDKLKLIQELRLNFD